MGWLVGWLGYLAPRVRASWKQYCVAERATWLATQTVQFRNALARADNFVNFYVFGVGNRQNVLVLVWADTVVRPSYAP